MGAGDGIHKVKPLSQRKQKKAMRLLDAGQRIEGMLVVAWERGGVHAELADYLKTSLRRYMVLSLHSLQGSRPPDPDELSRFLRRLGGIE